MRFKASVLALAALLHLVAQPAAAQEIGSGSIGSGSIGSGVIERNQSAWSSALGRQLAYNVYRPAAEPPSGARWPVIYLLEGRPSESDWLDQGFFWEIVDRAIAEGAIPPALFVIPVAPFSWYVDNPDPGGHGMMATAITRDLTAAIDKRYPTAACREARAVGGLSMGGYGATLFALTEPDAYVAGMSFAGAITPPMDRYDTTRVARADAFYDGAFGRPLDRTRFNAWNIFSQIRGKELDPGQKPALYLAAGDRDRGGLLQTLTRLHIELGRSGYDTTLRIGPGQHDWETWRNQLADALNWLGPRLDPSCGHAVADSGPAAPSMTSP